MRKNFPNNLIYSRSKFLRFINHIFSLLLLFALPLAPPPLCFFNLKLNENLYQQNSGKNKLQNITDENSLSFSY